jgi:diguanylate cyclase (GGDEF)-like protein
MDADTPPAAGLVVVLVGGLDEYQNTLLAGIQTGLAGSALAVLVLVDEHYPNGLPAPVERRLREAPAAGVIAAQVNTPAGQLEQRRLLAALGVPVVTIGAGDGAGRAVHGDNETGMRQLMAHLLDDCAVRRPVLIRGIGHQHDSVERERVFREELAARGLALDEDLVADGGFWHDVAYRSMRALLGRRRDLDAVVALNDVSAMGVQRALADEGLRVPQDVLLTGFDNEPGDFNWPGLTTVDQDVHGQGRRAAELLRELLGGGSPAAAVTVPSRLVVRGTTRRGEADRAALQEDAARMAQAGQTWVSVHNAIHAVNRELIHSETLDGVLDELASCLQQLAIGRAFLVLHDEDGVTSRLLLDHRDGRRHAPQSFGADRLLPEALGDQLSTPLVLQPLRENGREAGYLMLDRSPILIAVSKLLGLNISRTVENVLNTRRLQTHAATLARAVDEATEALRAEVGIRRRAQQDLQTANAELRRQVHLDGLTRLANRVAFEEHLVREWERNRRNGGELTLLMVDVDAFKAYNDRYGHLKGDEALQTVAACLRRSVLQPADLACRFGGEEFVVVLPDSGERAALVVAERFRRLLAEAAVPHAVSPVSDVLTATIGIAPARPARTDSVGDALEHADRALYQGKSAGRNAVAVYGRPQPVRSAG